MALTTYAELQAEIADWLNRSDLTARIPTFIVLAEAELNQHIVENKMETTASIALTNGEGTLPDDCLDVISVVVANHVIEPMTDRQADQFVSATHAYGVTVSGTTLRVLGGTSDTATVRYRQKVPALSDSNTSNWVLASHPNAYLYGALAHAEAFLVNDDRVPMFKREFAAAIQAISFRDIARQVHQAALTSAVGVGI